MDAQRVLLKSSTGISATNGWGDKVNLLKRIQKSPAGRTANRGPKGHITYGRARARDGTGLLQAGTQKEDSVASRAPIGVRALSTEVDAVANVEKGSNDNDLPMTNGVVIAVEAQENGKYGNSDVCMESECDSMYDTEANPDGTFASPIVAGDLSRSGCIDATTPANDAQLSLFHTPTDDAAGCDSDMVIVPATEQKTSNFVSKRQCDYELTDRQRFEDTLVTEDESEDEMSVVHGTPSFNKPHSLNDVKEEAQDSFTPSYTEGTKLKSDSTFMVSNQPMKVPRNLPNRIKVKQAADSHSSGAPSLTSSSEMNITFDIDRAAPAAKLNAFNSTYNAGLVTAKNAAPKDKKSKEEETPLRVASFISPNTARQVKLPRATEAIKEVVYDPPRKGKKQYAVPVNKNPPSEPLEIVNSSDSEFEAEPETMSQKKKKAKAPKTPAQKRDTKADIEALYETENPIQSTSAALVRHEKRVAKQIQDSSVVEKKASSRNERMAARNRIAPSPSPVSSTPHQKRRKLAISDETESTIETPKAAPQQPEAVTSNECCTTDENRECQKEIEPESVAMAVIAAKDKTTRKPRGRGRKPGISPAIVNAEVEVQSDELVSDTAVFGGQTVSSEMVEAVSSDLSNGVQNNGKCVSEIASSLRNLNGEIGSDNSDADAIRIGEDNELKMNAVKEEKTLEIAEANGDNKPEADNIDHDNTLHTTEINEVPEAKAPASTTEDAEEYCNVNEVLEEEKPELHAPLPSRAKTKRGTKRIKDSKSGVLAEEAEQEKNVAPELENEKNPEDSIPMVGLRSKGRTNRKRPAAPPAEPSKSRKKTVKEDEPPQVEMEPEPAASRNKRARKNTTQSIVVPPSPPKRGKGGRQKRAVPEPEVQEDQDTSQELRRSKRMRKCKLYDA